MVPGHRVTNKCHFLPSHYLEEHSVVESRKITLLRLPSPIEKMAVISSMLEAVLTIRDRAAA